MLWLQTKSLLCVATSHVPAEPLPQQYKSHKHPLATAEGIHPIAGALPKTVSSGLALGEVTVNPTIQEVIMCIKIQLSGCESSLLPRRTAFHTKAGALLHLDRAHASPHKLSKVDHAEMWIRNQEMSKQYKSKDAQLTELSTQVAKLIIQLERYEPRSESKDSCTETANKMEGTSKAKESKEAEMIMQEHEVSNYASNYATMNHKGSPLYHRATTLGQNKHAEEWQDQVQSGEPLGQDIK